MDFILVGLGGVFGAVLRYVVSKVVAERAGTSFPLGTWLVNITGAFLLSFLIGIAAQGIIGKELGLALTTGFLGAYTTFSTFSYETVRQIQDGEFMTAMVYVLFSVIFGLAAAWLGLLTSMYFV